MHEVNIIFCAISDVIILNVKFSLAGAVKVQGIIIFMINRFQKVLKRCAFIFMYNYFKIR